MLEKLKSLLADDTLFQAILLIIVAVASFGLGRYSQNWGGEVRNLENRPTIEVFAPMKSEVSASTSEPIIKQEAAVITVVGSKSGTKYHLPDCSGAKRIKPENLITFESIDAAKAAGYTPAANCPGL